MYTESSHRMNRLSSKHVLRLTSVLFEPILRLRRMLTEPVLRFSGIGLRLSYSLRPILLKWGIFFLLSVVSREATAQVVWENHHSPLYNFLGRMAQKGLIEFQDQIRPVNRMDMLELLDTLQTKKLSPIERTELNFYLQDFNAARATPTQNSPSINSPGSSSTASQINSPGSEQNASQLNSSVTGLTSSRLNVAGSASTSSLFNSPGSATTLLRKDGFGRFRVLGATSKDFKLFIDPIVGLKYVSGNKQTYRELSNGVNLWGQAGKFGYSLYYRDMTLTGSGLDLVNEEGPNTTFIQLINRDENKKNFSTVRAHVSYAWKNGSISLGNDHFLWGYGETGRIVTSDRSPTFPYLRLDYRPLKWLQFNYIHAWMNTNIIDSVRSYGTGTLGVIGDIRVKYIPKFLATHSITLLPLKGLSISIGESMIYSDKLDVGFLIPVNFFKVYDNNRSNYLINAGSNSQIFAQISSRNHIKSTHLYANVFVDEVRLTKIFDPSKSRNQLGYMLGASVTDIGIPYLTLGTEYTRVNPFAYRNLLPAQEYLHYKQELGDWMGNNFDRIALIAKYTPVPKLRLEARWWKIRKGGPGSLIDQYMAEPQPPFLFDYKRDRTDIMLNAHYEWINNLYFFAQYWQKTNKPVDAVKQTDRLLSVGFSYGL